MEAHNKSGPYCKTVCSKTVLQIAYIAQRERERKIAEYSVMTDYVFVVTVTKPGATQLSLCSGRDSETNLNHLVRGKSNMNLTSVQVGSLAGHLGRFPTTFS